MQLEDWTYPRILLYNISLFLISLVVDQYLQVRQAVKCREGFQLNVGDWILA